ncbi:hypothetical protein A3B87_02320 [Candidatus Kuenenbacteria bacterium RIFCSPHIGHO2_02_FULL_39_13]|uniref:histidine kinase n=1 Tax=Candidatus Kuenenbacteria bacterium RIFCSPHIGHO2_02_FULL_39_13 TaxID=1798561 RepID=A0A1F6FP52_9BACT|nr:MAG: hypothetical protein A3B87_02320 [Candidatus Kuenenbacteria bacterium RIFCSPHIGHO2_02_FULL_39_13]
MDKSTENSTLPLKGTETFPSATKLSSEMEKPKFWENPTFLFVLMGVLTMVVMISTYFIAQRYDDPMIVIASVSIVAGITTLIGGITIKTIDQLSQANRMKTEFVSIASHQLRTPLSIIKWYAEFLLKPEKQKNLTPEQLGYIKTINQANLRMIRLVNDLLDISRVESGKIQIQPEMTNIIELTKNIIAENHTLADQKKIKLQLKYDNTIPLLLVDPKRIAMVIENLLSNGIKYTRHDRHGVVSTELSKDGNKFLFSMADNGVGIPASDHKNIFKKFFRANNTMRLKTSGTGLGLFIAKAIVESHKGKMWFVSKENEGTTFYFNLPLKQKKLGV